jgi:pilus assembly protein CpaE
MAQNLSVLVVDPNLDSRVEIKRTASAIGLDSVGEAVYGTEATVLLQERKPTVILLALEDPPVRGLATLEALQQQSPDTPIVVYSSSLNPALMRQAMRAGARDYLEKPVSVRDLRDAIHTVLAQEEQRQLARWSEDGASRARGTVLTVAGAKGGIGKTTVATNLAIALREATGQDVVLVDCDAQFGDVAVMLDMDVERSIADLARNELEINRTTVAPYLARHSSGIDVLLAASEPEDWRALQDGHIAAIAHALAESHEYVVLDTPGTMNEVVASCLREAAQVLLVTSLDVSSVKDTKTAVRILDSWGVPHERLQLVVNDNTRASVVTVADVSEATGVPCNRLIPNDGRVGNSVQTGVPLIVSQPSSGFSRAIVELAESISGVAPAVDSRSFLTRLSVIGRRA